MHIARRLWAGFSHGLTRECRSCASRMSTLTRICRPFALFVGAVMVGANGADDFRLTRWTIDGGGEVRCAGGAFEISGTIGQPDTGVMRGPGFELAAGFWFPVSAGDCDTDGVVGLVDFGSFHPCVSGPDGTAAPDCTCYDLDRDNDVDLADIAELQLTFDGG